MVPAPKVAVVEAISNVNQLEHGKQLAVKATLNRFRHYIISGHAKMTPRQTIASCVAACKGELTMVITYTQKGP